jgi:CHAT domain-containing protein/tetratricopeptide (TPR) repeat protein
MNAYLRKKFFMLPTAASIAVAIFVPLQVKAQDLQDQIRELKSRINAHHERGENEEATDLCEEVLKLTLKKYAGRRLSPEQSMEVAQARLNLTQFYKFVGRFADAEQLLLDQVEDWKDIPDWKAQASSNLGDLYLMIGDYESALNPVLDALSAKMNGFAGRTGVYDMFAKEMTDALLVLFESGRYEQASKMAESAIELCERTYGGDSGPFNEKFAVPRAIQIRSNLRLGNNPGSDVALGRLADAMRDTIQSTLKNEPLANLKNIGFALLESGDAETASYVFEGAAPQVGLLLPQSGELLDGYAWSLLKKEDPDKNKALLVVRKSVEAKSAIMPRVHRFNERRRVLWQVSQLQFALPAAVLPDREFAEVVVAWKGSTAESILREARQNSGLGGNPDKQKLSALQRARANLEAAAYAGHDDVPKLEETVKTLERELLSASGSQPQNAGDESPDLDAVQAALGPGEAVVEFVQLTGEPGRTSAPDYAALVITSDKIKRCADIDGGNVSAALRDFYSCLEKGDDGQIGAALESLRESAYTSVARELPDDCRRIFVSADGALHFVPFAALIGNDGKFLGESKSIAYLASSRDLARSGPSIDEKSSSKTAALFANPVFSRRPSGGDSLPQLPGAEKECADVSAAFESAGYTVEKLSGPAATEESFKKTVSPAVLHVATHGFLANATAAGSSGVRGMAVKGLGKSANNPAQNDSPEADPARVRKKLTDESARTVLAFAGAEDSLRQWLKGDYPDPASDGIITPSEAAAMNLSGTWIVALSACQSGQGDSVGGEGVFGLRRAFMVAGARSLLMTLWPVVDETTAQIMKDFYEEALAKRDMAEALADVQKRWLAKIRDERGLAAAVREAGPFAAALMANPKVGFVPVANVKKEPTAEDRIKKIEDAARLGDTEAMVALGFIYGKGEGVPKDREKALEWYGKAFKAGDPQGAIGNEALIFPVDEHMSPAAKRLRAEFDKD